MAWASRRARAARRAEESVARAQAGQVHVGRAIAWPAWGSIRAASRAAPESCGRAGALPSIAVGMGPIRRDRDPPASLGRAKRGRQTHLEHQDAISVDDHESARRRGPARPRAFGPSHSALALEAELGGGERGAKLIDHGPVRAAFRAAPVTCPRSGGWPERAAGHRRSSVTSQDRERDDADDPRNEEDEARQVGASHPAIWALSARSRGREEGATAPHAPSRTWKKAFRKLPPGRNTASNRYRMNDRQRPPTDTRPPAIGADPLVHPSSRYSPGRGVTVLVSRVSMLVWNSGRDRALEAEWIRLRLCGTGRQPARVCALCPRLPASAAPRGSERTLPDVHGQGAIPAAGVGSCPDCSRQALWR